HYPLSIIHSPSMLSVELDNLTKRYGQRTVLAGVSATFTAGETVALIGPSGGGKSTMLRCINGLATFEGGEVRVGPHRLTPARSPCVRGGCCATRLPAPLTRS